MYDKDEEYLGKHIKNRKYKNLALELVTLETEIG